jgi:chemotaxis protein histidine kinase CheA
MSNIQLSTITLTLFDPLLFLGCSILLVAVSLTALVVAAFPAIQDLSRAARSAEKLFDRLDRELPPTLEAIRLAGLELSDLSDEMSQGVQSASAVAQQVDLSLTQVKKQAGNVQTNTRSVWIGVKAAWRTWQDRG